MPEFPETCTRGPDESETSDDRFHFMRMLEASHKRAIISLVSLFVNDQ